MGSIFSGQTLLTTVSLLYGLNGYVLNSPAFFNNPQDGDRFNAFTASKSLDLFPNQAGNWNPNDASNQAGPVSQNINQLLKAAGFTGLTSGLDIPSSLVPPDVVQSLIQSSAPAGLGSALAGQSSPLFAMPQAPQQQAANFAPPGFGPQPSLGSVQRAQMSPQFGPSQRQNLPSFAIPPQQQAANFLPPPNFGPQTSLGSVPQGASGWLQQQQASLPPSGFQGQFQPGSGFNLQPGMGSFQQGGRPPQIQFQQPRPFGLSPGQAGQQQQGFQGPPQQQAQPFGGPSPQFQAATGQQSGQSFPAPIAFGPTGGDPASVLASLNAQLGDINKQLLFSPFDGPPYPSIPLPSSPQGLSSQSFGPQSWPPQPQFPQSSSSSAGFQQAPLQSGLFANQAIPSQNAIFGPRPQVVPGMGAGVPNFQQPQSPPQFPFSPTTQGQFGIAPFSAPCTQDAVGMNILYHADPSDPTRYIKCDPNSGIPQSFACQGGKVWNPLISRCSTADVLKMFLQKGITINDI